MATTVVARWRHHADEPMDCDQRDIPVAICAPWRICDCAGSSPSDYPESCNHDFGARQKCAFCSIGGVTFVVAAHCRGPGRRRDGPRCVPGVQRRRALERPAVSAPRSTSAAATFTIPAGEARRVRDDFRILGTSGDPNSTAGVDVCLDGVEVAQCVKPDPSCWIGDIGQRPVEPHVHGRRELLALNDGGGDADGGADLRRAHPPGRDDADRRDRAAAGRADAVAGIGCRRSMPALARCCCAAVARSGGGRRAWSRPRGSPGRAFVCGAASPALRHFAVLRGLQRLARPTAFCGA